MTINTMLIGALALCASLGLALYVKHAQHEISLVDEARLNIERQQTSARLRAYGQQSAEENLKHPMLLAQDPLAPEEPSDADEVAQAKLWHHTPASQRKKLIPSTSQDVDMQNFGTN